MDILGTYDIGGLPAIIAFEYGKGRVFISGVHPEYEENSERDGLPVDAERDDRGSDWEMVRRALCWGIKG